MQSNRYADPVVLELWFYFITLTGLLCSPFDKLTAFACAPVLAIGSGGWGATLGAIAIWLRSEYAARR